MTILWGAYWIGVIGFAWVAASVTQSGMRSRARAGRPAVTLPGAGMLAAAAVAIVAWPIFVPVALIFLRDKSTSPPTRPDERL